MKRFVIAISVLACCALVTGCIGMHASMRSRNPNVVLPALAKWKAESGMAGITDIFGAPDEAEWVDHWHEPPLLYKYHLSDGSTVLVKRGVTTERPPISHKNPGTVLSIEHIDDTRDIWTVYYHFRLWQVYSNKTQDGIAEELGKPSE